MRDPATTLRLLAIAALTALLVFVLALQGRVREPQRTYPALVR
jgi:hypothetical protein